MSKKVNINCKYFQVRECIQDDITDNIVDLRNWLMEILETELSERYRSINEVRGRVENIIRKGETDIYSINFMRMDDFSSSYILKIDDVAEHVDIDVEAEEYIAKNTVCLYDAQNGIIMIQSNRGGYSEKAIESYMNSYLEANGLRCCLIPILETVNFLGENTEYAKLDIRLANLQMFTPSPNTSFENIIKGLKGTEGINAHLEISLGNVKTKKLNTSQTRQIIKDLFSNRGCVTSAKIKLTDDAVSGVYDLFETLCCDVITCNVDKKGGITFEEMSKKMSDTYILKGARERLVRNIRQ